MVIKLNGLKKGEIILYLISAVKYAQTNLEILNHYINKKNNYCVYITVNKPYATLMKMLKEKGVKIDKIFVIDAITPVSSGMTRAGNCVFCGTPKALTDISISATSAIKSMPSKDRFLFLDSLSTLIVYNETGSVTKFAHFLVNKMKEWGISGAIISLEKETDEKMLSQLSQFVDKVIEVK